jgi:hypothetical protein
MTTIRSLALAAALTLSLGTVGAFAAPPAGQPNKGASTTKGESTKKPGEACEKFAHNSDAFNDCVQAQAKSDKKSKGKGKTAPSS